MQKPKMILADEPIASLDPLNAKIVMDSLRDINEREEITVITNLHTLDTARNYCDRIIGMAAGKVVFDGTADELDADAVRMIYGAGDGATLSEGITSTQHRAWHDERHRQEIKEIRRQADRTRIRGQGRRDRLARVNGHYPQKRGRTGVAGRNQERYPC